MAAANIKGLVDLALSGASKLHAEFDGVFSEQTVRRCLAESTTALMGSPVSDYVPIFAYRFARERLRAAAQAEGSIAKPCPKYYLFAFTMRAEVKWLLRRCSG